jgi:hypothetical protein
VKVIPKVSMTSTLGGQDKIKKTVTASTGLIDASRKVQDAPSPRKKARLRFNELLAKYKREGATKDRSNQPNSANGVKAPPRHKCIHHQRGNFSQYPFVRSVMSSSCIILAIIHLLIIVVCTRIRI